MKSFLHSLSSSVPPFLLFNQMAFVESHWQSMPINQATSDSKLNKRNGGRHEEFSAFPVFLRSSVPLVQSGCLR